MVKLSRYSVLIPTPDKEYFLVKNYFSGAVALIRKKIKEILEALPSVDSSVNWKNSKEKLFSEGIIVPIDRNEEECFKSIFNRMRFDSPIFSSYLVTTTKCNLVCPYCYEKEIPRITMNPNLYSEVLKWYKSKLANRSVKAFRVILYGGEPLIDITGIKRLIPGLWMLVEKQGIPFCLSLITNGTLLKGRIVEFLMRYGLDTVQVTIDGPPSIHDQRRIGKNGKSSFWLILENLNSLIGKIQDVTIRVNFDAHNLEQIPFLLDILSEKNWQLKVNLAFNATEKIFSGEFCSYCLPSGTKRLVEAYLYLWEEAQKRGFSIPEVVDRGPCMSCEEDGVVIGPKGEIYKCIETIGRQKFVVGGIKQRNYKRSYSKYIEADYLNWCLRKTDCPLLPVCAGGCRFDSYIRTGSCFDVDCQRRFLEEINAKLTLLRYSSFLKTA